MMFLFLLNVLCTLDTLLSITYQLYHNFCAIKTNSLELRSALCFPNHKELTNSITFIIVFYDSISFTNSISTTTNK